MIYKLFIAPTAKKQLKKIKKIYQEAINSAVKEIKEDPHLSKPLGRELIRKYTFHISVYRIIYKVNEADKTINILKIDHRSKVYH